MDATSAAAKKKWESLNDITTLDLNNLNDSSAQVSQKDDPVYLKRVLMSDVALLKIVMLASPGNSKSVLEIFKELDEGRKELGGLFIGKVCGDAIVVRDACDLPLEGDHDINSQLLEYFKTRPQTGKFEDVVGWYRTSTFGRTPTETDISTQMRIQMLKDPCFALIIDAGSTIDIMRVLVQAFRAYPEGYSPFPAHMNRKRNRPDLSLQVYPHLAKRYTLRVTYFKSSFGSNKAWGIFWNHLISTPKIEGKTIGREVSAEGGPIEDGKARYFVRVKTELTKNFSSPQEAVDKLFVKLVKEVGSSESESKIYKPQKLYFYATLTDEQAMRLAVHDSVKHMKAMPGTLDFDYKLPNVY